MNREAVYDYLIIGAGLAGLSTAYFLTQKKAGRVAVVERENAPGKGASGQNASMVCQLAEEPSIAKMAAESARTLRGDWAKAMPAVGFRPCGSLFVAEGPGLRALEAGAREAARNGVRTDFLKRHEAVRRFPFLEESAFKGGYFTPSDGTVDVASLVRELARAAARSGAEIFYSVRSPVGNRPGGFEVRHRGGTIRARVAVNAGGAWAGEDAREAGARPIPVRPFKRHIFVTGPLKWVDPRWPIVWDTTRRVYFRTEGRRLLFSPCDETRSKPGPGARRLLEKKIKAFLPRAAGAGFPEKWAGLRTFAPDGKFVIGWDAELENFFWVAGLGGHGVTTCAAVGELASSLLLRHNIDRELQKAFDPRRFR